MSAAPIPKRFNRDEFYKLGELGFLDERSELIEGEILEMPPIGPDHASVGTSLRRILDSQLPVEWHVRDGLPLDLGERNQPQPDLAVVFGSPRAFLFAHPTGAALVVEISRSSLDYDRQAKSILYAEAGIHEYWVVDLVRKTIEAYRDPRGTGYTSATSYGQSETIETTQFPGVRVQIKDLF